MASDDNRFAKGLDKMEELFGRRYDPDGSVMPEEFIGHTVAHLFGDIWQNPALSIQERSLLTCTLLVALNRENEQRLHFPGARNIGIPREKLEAAITHAAHYAGWPSAVSAFAILEDVWPAESDGPS
ncbi:MAG: carboxymuconolactone decarboxylase family protein [Pseudomonadota bacterium]